MIVLDTNVISELMHSRAHPDVVAWVDEQPVDHVHLTAVTTAKLRYEVARLPSGRRKIDLADRVRRTIEEDFTGRILHSRPYRI
jgi:toxin FitB